MAVDQYITPTDALFAHLTGQIDKGEQRRSPWTWSLRSPEEAAALGDLIGAFVACFNETFASSEDDLIPPCWAHHPALATELAAHIWLWHAAHHDPQPGTGLSGDYYLRHLPGFRSRITATLGRSPTECRQGQHPDTWRSEVDAVLHDGQPSTRLADDPAGGRAIDRLRLYGFGFA
jgi:hypothetical protein